MWRCNQHRPGLSIGACASLTRSNHARCTLAMQKIDVKKFNRYGGAKFHRTRDAPMGLAMLLILCSTRSLHEEGRRSLARLLRAFVTGRSEGIWTNNAIDTAETCQISRALVRLTCVRSVGTPAVNCISRDLEGTSHWQVRWLGGPECFFY